VKQVMGQYIKDEEEARVSGPVNMGAMMGHILSVLQKHRVSLRGDVAMTIVTMSISEGLIRQLDPHFDIMTRAIPYFVRFRSWGTTSLRSRAAP
jgi:predicted unusual protein kinase regulating ubiquinone biosynthesis (AarF/ABC1/UbiB family)